MLSIYILRIFRYIHDFMIFASRICRREGKPSTPHNDKHTKKVQHTSWVRGVNTLLQEAWSPLLQQQRTALEIREKATQLQEDLKKVRATHEEILSSYNTLANDVHQRLTELEQGALPPYQILPETTVRITNVMVHVPFNELRKCCETVGAVRSIHRDHLFDPLGKSPATYYVTYSSPGDCEKACELLDGSVLHGLPLKVRYKEHT